jgi:hypothetical protein
MIPSGPRYFLGIIDHAGEDAGFMNSGLPEFLCKFMIGSYLLGYVTELWNRDSESLASLSKACHSNNCFGAASLPEFVHYVFNGYGGCRLI